MALPDVFRSQPGSTITLKSSGGTYALSLASVSNGACRQSAKIDLGASRALEYDVFADLEFAATPTAGNPCDFYWGPSGSATAGTDNPGGVGGTDSAFTGYSSNADASLLQLQAIGTFLCTAQATSTVQKGYVGRFSPGELRYGTLVFRNGSGAAMHSSDANMQIRLVPVEPTIEDS